MNKIKQFLFAIIILLASCKSNTKEELSDKNNTEIIQFIPFPGGTETSLPHLFNNKEATILSWVKKIDDSTTQFNYSYLKDNKWLDPKEIIRGKDWFVNWADYPSITENDGNKLAHFLKKSSKETFAYDIKLNVLPESVTKWQTMIPLHTDGSKTEHGFVTALPYNESSFFITWLDGRNMVNKNGHDHGVHGDAMTIRAAEVASDGSVSNNMLLDGKTCSCCQTTAAITSNGPIVLYRDRTDEEIRDIAITRQVNGIWTKPKFIYKDGWKINGCPVNGPKVDAIGNNVAVVWFTAVNGEPKVKLVFSENGGENFLAPILISNNEALGRVDLELISTDTVIVSWMESIEEATYLKAMKVNKLGIKSTPIVISQMNGSRKTGFPQMERVGEKILFAWTAIAGETSNIKTALVSLDNFKFDKVD